MTKLEEFIEKKGYKPLTEKEISKGKDALCIYGTKTPMPWSTIFTRIESGQDIEEIGKQYGHARKIALFAQLHGVTADPQLEEFVTTEARQREQIQEIANEHGVEKAVTLLQRVNEIAPDFEKKVAMFADKMVKKAIDKLDEKYIEASDMVNLAKAVQTTTDTVGVTQRHASATQINTGDIKVTGFDFVLGAPPPQAQVTDADVVDIEEDKGETDG